jgi:transposase
MAYINGVDRSQMVMFPEVLDDYVTEESVVRFIDAFVEKLDLNELNFERATPKETGRPGYDPGDLLRLYVYGYWNGIRSSRKLEREAGRNVELMWLLRRLEPDFKTIADFRKDNLKGIKGVCREFTLLCKEMGMIGGELFGVDGSKFKAVNSKERNFTAKKLEKRIKWADEKIEKYLEEMDKADKEEGAEKKLSAEELKEKIEKLRKRMDEDKRMVKELKESGETQKSLTDSEARLMKTRHGADVCYNAQIAVDSKNRLIIADDVNNAVSDQGQLANIAKQAKEVLAVASVEVVTDRGYYDCDQVKQCEDAGISVYMGKPPTSNHGLFTKQDFKYDAQGDVYICPAGEELTHRTTESNGVKRYKTDACRKCSLRERCTKTESGRMITRRTDEAVMERMASRVRENPEKMELRKTLVEHPFGTIKRNLGLSYFLLKGEEKVRAEFSLGVFAYNLKRMMTIVGAKKMIAALAWGLC